MARMHARRKGKSGSKKPLSKKAPGWVTYKASEVEKLIIKLAKQGYGSAKIGLILRDYYGIPNVRMITKKTVSDILKKNDLYPKLPEDLQNLIKKVISINKHRETNKKDVTSKRSLQLTESKIRRLVNYYKRTKVLPEDWKYDPKKAELLLR